MKLTKKIFQLDDDATVRAFDDGAESWYVFEDVLKSVFEIEDPLYWLKRIKLNEALWKVLSSHLVEFPIEESETGLIEIKQCMTTYGLWCFLSLFPKFKALNCSQHIVDRLAKRHEESEINTVEWQLRIMFLATQGKLRPETGRQIEFELMGESAKLKAFERFRYKSMSQIDRWLYDIRTYTLSQSMEKVDEEAGHLNTAHDLEERLKSFGQIVKDSLQLNFYYSSSTVY